MLIALVALVALSERGLGGHALVLGSVTGYWARGLRLRAGSTAVLVLVPVPWRMKCARTPG